MHFIEANLHSKREHRQTKHFLDYRFRLMFLGIKNAWTMYMAKKDELGITVEGKEIQRYFDSGKLVTLINISIENSLTQKDSLD